MGQINELKDFTRGQLDAALMMIGDQVGMKTGEAIQAFLRGDLEVIRKVKTPLILLDFISTINIPATTGKFIAKAKFVLDTSRKAKVKIGFVGGNFLDWFGDVVEDPVTEQVLRYHKLRQLSVDGPMITELGGVEKVKLSLTHTFSLMEGQPNGEAGHLLTNGFANILYVPQKVTKLEGNKFSYANRKGETIEETVSDAQYLFEVAGQWFVLRAVHVRWHGDGWRVHARSVGYPYGWVDGYQVFSRN